MTPATRPGRHTTGGPWARNGSSSAARRRRKRRARSVDALSIRLRWARSQTAPLRALRPARPAMSCGTSTTVGSRPGERVHGVSWVVRGMPYHSLMPRGCVPGPWGLSRCHLPHRPVASPASFGTCGSACSQGRMPWGSPVLRIGALLPTTTVLPGIVEPLGSGPPTWRPQIVDGGATTQPRDRDPAGDRGPGPDPGDDGVAHELGRGAARGRATGRTPGDAPGRDARHRPMAGGGSWPIVAGQARVLELVGQVGKHSHPGRSARRPQPPPTQVPTPRSIMRAPPEPHRRRGSVPLR